jgi:hypothetical protein
MAITTDILQSLTLDDANNSGGNPQDISGEGNHGTNSGATLGVTGHINEGYSFTTNDTVNTGGLIAGSSNYTISLWFKCDNTTQVSYLYQMVQGVYFGIRINNGVLNWRMSPGGGGWTEINTVFTDTTSWHHVVMTWDGTDIEGWLDGVSKGTNGVPNTNSGADGARLGGQANDTGAYFEGDIDEYSLWDAKKSDAEIATLWNGGSGVQYPFVPISYVPPQPTNMVATAVSSSQIDLTWTDNASGTSQEDNYIVQRSKASDSGWTTLSTEAQDATSYSDTGLAEKEIYWYRVYGTNVIGDGDVSSSDSDQTWETQDTDQTGDKSGMAEIETNYPVVSGLALANRHHGRQTNLIAQGLLGRVSTVLKRFKRGIQ